jgi:hypothetical protein
MTRRKGREETPTSSSPIRRAPLPELKIFEISESELDRLEKGSSGSIYLNFALFLLGIASTLLVTLATTTIASIYLFAAFVSICAVTLILGLLLLVLWWGDQSSSAGLIAESRERMPPSVRETTGTPVGGP